LGMDQRGDRAPTNAHGLALDLRPIRVEPVRRPAASRLPRA
jgi:hypothetical protein